MRIVNILIIAILLCITACSSFNPFEEEGDYTEKRVVLDGITAIENLNTFQIVFIQDEEEYIVLKGGENLISKTEIITNNELLKINHSYSNNTRNFDLIIVEIHLKNLDKITCLAPANILSKNTLTGKHLDVIITSESELVEMSLNLDYQSLNFHSHGSACGAYEFYGKCPKTNYTLNGVININASKLQNKITKLAQNGIGEAHIWANDTLNLTIYSSGDIYYKGNPEIAINRVQVNNQSPDANVIQE
nr:DUF2807 domain-containing protein [uncultured Marinifilum sp.]